RQLLREIFPHFHGAEIKTIGDAFLVEFGSALEAAQCAIEIQRALAKRNADVLPDRRIEVKIGIHIGDVVHRGGDVYGDGVNIASRIEPLAGAGGICVSMDVERQIRNAVETRFEKLAATELKNISVPMELFRIVLPWERQLPPSPTSSTVFPPARARSWIWISAAVVLLLIIGIGWWWRTLPHKSNTVHSEPVVGASEIAANIPEKSIAVLPFENLSDDKANAYFTEGIQDEILTRLSKIADLKVISRTSTQKYKSAPDNLRDIAKQLGVANILEGSVQKAANAVHINVQLIRTATDEHLWAESYDRDLKNIFGVEREIAETIAGQLKAQLTGAEQKAIAEAPTDNVAAHDAHIRGVNIVNKAMTVESAAKAATEFAEAVRLDPNFAQAWARLAVVRSFLYFNGLDSGASVKEAVDRAVALQPDSGESWLAQAVYRYRVLRQFPSALEAYREAQKRMPNDSDVLEQMAHLERRLGQKEAAEQHYRAAAQLDPKNGDTLFTLAELLSDEGRAKDSDEVLDRLLTLSPGNEEALAQKATNLQQEGQLSESAAVLNKIDPNSGSTNVAVTRIIQLFYERRLEDFIAMVKAGKPVEWANDPRTITFLGYTQLLVGHREDARQTFTRALAVMKGPDGQIPVDARMLPAFAMTDYAGLGEKEQALAEAQRARAAYKDDALSRPFVETQVAGMQVMLGQNDAAITTLSRLADSGDLPVRS
ncbi:MAG TPA: adenylate/guanylate cyclase domain-containing protein, partial [Chthoniobacterales bacterium]